MATLLKTQEIQITGVRFKRDSDRVRFESYPKRLVYKGRTYTLAKA